MATLRFKQPVIEIITIGNELLIGKILNTNAHWICKRVVALGGKVDRVVTVPDDVSEISAEIRYCIQRKPDTIVTVGGLGPTFDDKTLQGVAEAINMPLEVNSEALGIVKEKYRHLVEKSFVMGADMTVERVKMAVLPQNSRPIFNPIGTAPAVLTIVDSTEIVSLPGVPKEMESIFEASVACKISEKAKGLRFVEKSLVIKNIPESDLAPMINKAKQSVPQVYIKSHPRDDEKHSFIELHLSTAQPPTEDALKYIANSAEIIRSLVEKAGGLIESP